MTLPTRGGPRRSAGWGTPARPPPPSPAQGRACALVAAARRSRVPRPSPAGHRSPTTSPQEPAGRGRGPPSGRRSLAAPIPGWDAAALPGRPGKSGRTSGNPPGSGRVWSQPRRRTSQIPVVVVYSQCTKFLPSASSLPPHLLLGLPVPPLRSLRPQSPGVGAGAGARTQPPWGMG